MEKSRRYLAILLCLSIRKHYKGPVAELRDELDVMGYSDSLSAVRANGDFLEETGLIRFDRAHDVFALTERGLEVAMGNSIATGVAAPGPKA